jgi:hypothetical protein
MYKSNTKIFSCWPCILHMQNTCHCSSGSREDGMGLNYTKGSDETRIMHSMPQASSCCSGKYSIVRRTCTVHAVLYVSRSRSLGARRWQRYCCVSCIRNFSWWITRPSTGSITSYTFKPPSDSHPRYPNAIFKTSYSIERPGQTGVKILSGLCRENCGRNAYCLCHICRGRQRYFKNVTALHVIAYAMSSER